MRTRAKRDANEPAIVEALEAAGVCVLRVSSPGAPDLLLFDPAGRLCWLGSHHQYLPAEVKARRGALTPAQERFRAQATYPILRSVESALWLVGVQT